MSLGYSHASILSLLSRDSISRMGIAWTGSTRLQLAQQYFIDSQSHISSGAAHHPLNEHQLYYLNVWILLNYTWMASVDAAGQVAANYFHLIMELI